MLIPGTLKGFMASLRVVRRVVHIFVCVFDYKLYALYCPLTFENKEYFLGTELFLNDVRSRFFSLTICVL